jgi:hypothetical protein
MVKPIIEVVENELKHANEELEVLKQEIIELKKWKANCTKWAVWWAGVCAAVMTTAAIIQSYWEKFVNLIIYLNGAK